ncbi:MAG: N-acetylmuramoyl-L-alanine amidase [Candidatus Moraniibacteriota bacterium]
MGLIGLLITVLLMILGAGYFLFGTSSGPITLENKNTEQPSVADITTGAGEIARYQAIRDQAQGVSKQVTENSKQLAESIEQGIANSEQGTVKTAVVPLSSGASAVGKEKTDLNIIDRKVDFGFGVPKEKRMIDTVVLHSSYNSIGGDPYSVNKVIDIWRGYSVAPHYMIDRKGNIYRLVDDANIAYHAGVSKLPDGRTNVNDFSIGIEILNTKEDKYTEAEYDAVNTLIAYLRGKYSIKQVVGHADIAPGRKDDPWHFNWKQLK